MAAGGKRLPQEGAASHNGHSRLKAHATGTLSELDGWLDGIVVGSLIVTDPSPRAKSDSDDCTHPGLQQEMRV